MHSILDTYLMSDQDLAQAFLKINSIEGKGMPASSGCPQTNSMSGLTQQTRENLQET